MDLTEIFFHDGTLQWQPILVMAFALAFVVIGFFRTVEFQGIGLKSRTKKILITFHCLGVLLFASALFLGATQPPGGELRALMFGLFMGALVLFAPGQFLIGMARKKALESKMVSEGKTVVHRKPLFLKFFNKKKN